MLKSYFQAIHYDKNMSYLRRSPRYRSHSFVHGFLKLHYRLMDNTTSVSITDVAGVGQTVGVGNTFGSMTLNSTAPGRGGAGQTTSQGSATSFWGSATTLGIVIGTGTTAVAPTDYQLATQIIDGTSSATIEHFPCAGTGFTTAGLTASFTMERLFRNSSGGSITVNETGIYCGTDRHSGFGTLYKFQICIIRDLVSPGFAVLNGEYMRIIYTISVTA